MPLPFHGKEFEFTQPDGSKIKVRGWGNQNRAIFETLDGYTVMKDPLTSFYQYAKLSTDKNYLEPTGVKVGLVDAEMLQLNKHLRGSKDLAGMSPRSAFHSMGSKTRWQERREQARSVRRMAMTAPGISAAPPREERRGEYVGLCLLIQFPDVPGSIPKSEVEDFCNKEGYSNFGNNGSVYDYFYDESLGRLKYKNFVVSYYTAKNPKGYYTNSYIPHGYRARELVEEALSDLKAKGFNFSQLSVDNQGYVYALNVFYAGSCDNNWGEGLWPHSWCLASDYYVGNGIKFKDYQITDMGSELTLVTFCHENGHMVCDFPDLYDYGLDDPGENPESVGVGDYCLMCCGGPDEKNPTRICAYLKYKAGWADKVTTLAEGAYIAKAGKNELFIWPKNLVEYYIIENRFKEKRDSSLPASGLAIWHVDELGSNDYEEMLPTKHYECSLEQADNRFELERFINRGNESDLFCAEVKSSFGDSTAPNSKWWDGTSSGLEIVDISNRSNEMSVKLGKKVKKLHKTSNPDKKIPDNDQNGVHDGIIFEKGATISWLKVSVDITHSYRGDLRLTLISPSSNRAVLHDRKGARAHDLKTTFDISSTPELRNFINQPLKGEWVLLVQDFAAWDEGVLNSWSLEMEYVEDVTSNVVEMVDETSVEIPDNDPAGITRTMTADAPGNVKNLEVSIDITHPWIGDLIVTLISPRGTSIDLHHRTGQSEDNIIKSYTTSTTSELEKFVGETIEGDWSLKVADMAGKDKGKLNRWSLKIIPE